MALLPSLMLLVAAAQPQDGEAALAKIVGDRLPQPPVDCISPSDIRSVRIVDGTAIVYEANGRLYVNRPSTGAATLRRDDVLATRVYGAQLCRLDAITLVDAVARMPRGFVVLGSFVPYARPPRR